MKHSFLLPHISISPRYYYASLFPQGNPSKLSKDIFSFTRMNYKVRSNSGYHFSLNLPKEYNIMNITSMEGDKRSKQKIRPVNYKPAIISPMKGRQVNGKRLIHNAKPNNSKQILNNASIQLRSKA